MVSARGIGWGVAGRGDYTFLKGLSHTLKPSQSGTVYFLFMASVTFLGKYVPIIVKSEK